MLPSRCLSSVRLWNQVCRIMNLMGCVISLKSSFVFSQDSPRTPEHRRGQLCWMNLSRGRKQRRGVDLKREMGRLPKNERSDWFILRWALITFFCIRISSLFISMLTIWSSLVLLNAVIYLMFGLIDTPWYTNKKVQCLFEITVFRKKSMFHPSSQAVLLTLSHSFLATSSLS